MKKLLAFLLACASTFYVKGQSIPVSCTNDEEILLKERPIKLNERLALKIIRKKADTAFFKLREGGAQEGSEDVYYYHISTFPPRVKVIKKIDRVFLVSNPTSEPAWKWGETRTPYYEKVRRNTGLIGWWCASFILSFLLAWAIIGKSDFANRSLWAILVCSLCVGLIANGFNTAPGTEAFFIWDKLFSLIGTSFTGVVLYVFIFPIRRFIVDVINYNPPVATL